MKPIQLFVPKKIVPQVPIPGSLPRVPQHGTSRAPQGLACVVGFFPLSSRPDHSHHLDGFPQKLALDKSWLAMTWVEHSIGK